MDARDEVGERIVVVANRVGREGDVGYAGTSVVMGVGGGREKVGVWGVLGRGEEGVLVVDTEMEAKWVLETRATDDEK